MEDIEAQAREWTASSTEALKLVLAGREEEAEFSPEFTYPIFGDEELVFGYQGLEFTLKFDSMTLLPQLNVKFNKKLEELVKGNPEDPLVEVLPREELYRDGEKWNQRRLKEREEFKIPGQMVKQFQTEDSTYVIHKVAVKDAIEFHRRLQVFVLLFIEAGSYIEEDDRWDLYVVYDKETNDFCGFCTVYPYFWFKDATTHDSIESYTALRKRISQFVILPPYQSKGLGKNLYNAIVDECMTDEKVRQVTVEDPSEAFDDLRDRCDLARVYDQLVEDAQFKAPFDEEYINQLVERTKLTERQAIRCVEMALLHKMEIPSKAYKLQLKRRLYLRNREGLADKTSDEVKELLDGTYRKVIEDYERIMNGVKLDTQPKRVKV